MLLLMLMLIPTRHYGLLLVSPVYILLKSNGCTQTYPFQRSLCRVLF